MLGRAHNTTIQSKESTLVFKISPVEKQLISKMNLIINRQLNQAQNQMINELTLKKRQSKKSTMSEKQVAARQQLALELMQERKVLPNDKLLHVNFRGLNLPTDLFPQNDDQSLLEEQPSTGSIETSTTSSGTTSALFSSCSSSSSCCFSRSDSNYSDSSQDSSANLIDQLFLKPELQERKKEASIKFNKTRLEHLNSELERRLNQYEYLMAQEKALLGAYNVTLITSQGVNNFHQH